MKEEWLFKGAMVPVDMETTAALVAEIHRLIGVVGGMALAQPERPVQEPSATRKCRSCDGTGERWTGIDEAPTAICKPCSGTGQIATAPPAAQPVQEPICYASINKQGDVRSTLKQRDDWRTVPLYTTPQQRPWVGLTEEKIKTTLLQLYRDINQMKLAPNDQPQKETVGFLFARAIEQILKEKNFD